MIIYAQFYPTHVFLDRKENCAVSIHLYLILEFSFVKSSVSIMPCMVLSEASALTDGEEGN